MDVHPGELERDAFRQELERVVASAVFRNTEALRRLLTYLGDAYLAGAAREIKEYSIGRDVMGKPPDYDPRTDASVRVQIGKLRQRLEEYYAKESPDAAVRITLPKGHFELVLEQRPAAATLPPARSSLAWKWAAILCAGGCLVLGALLFSRPRAWPTEVSRFWDPFLAGRRPVTVVLGSPLFIRFNTAYYRDPWANDWEEVKKTVPLTELQQLLKSPTPASETHRWTPFGEAAAAFHLALLLGQRKDDLVLKRSTVLSWEDVRTSNLIFLGPEKFNPQLRELPADPDFVIDQGAVRNLRPRPGEAASYQKPSPPGQEEIPAEYSLVTRVRGVEGWGEILVLSSTSTEGTWAAAEYVTAPDHLRELFSRLTAGGAMPDNYQVLLRSRFKQQVPIHIEYVTHHELKMKAAPPAR